jgi:xylulose-5-phosphate/fructose-6-phosphate phosphoketolase
MGGFLRDVRKLNMPKRNFRLFSPDENNSNRWQDVLEVTNRAWQAETFPYDDHLASDGSVMEVLSEHQCQGWLEGYLLTGRHGFFSCYEAFIHIVDSMVNQHAKWLKVCNQIEWRRPIASRTLLCRACLAAGSHGFSHQDPGFIDYVMNKKAEVVRIHPRGPTPTTCSRSPTIAAQSQLHQRRRRRQAARAAMARWTKRPSTARPGSASGVGQQRPRQRADVVMARCGDVPT